MEKHRPQKEINQCYPKIHGAKDAVETDIGRSKVRKYMTIFIHHELKGS